MIFISSNDTALIENYEEMVGSSSSFVHKNLLEIFNYVVFRKFYVLTKTPQRPITQPIVVGAHLVFASGRREGLTDEQIFEDLEQRAREMYFSAGQEKAIVPCEVASLPKNIHQ